MTGQIEEKLLPVYGAGSIEVPFVIAFHQEDVVAETHWPAHSHPTHELLWNAKGVSSVTVDSHIWTITPAIGMWIPAGVLHSGRAAAGSRCNMSHFGVNRVESISETPVPVELTHLLKLLLQKLSSPALAESSRRITEAAALDNLLPASREVSIQMPKAALLQPIIDEMLHSYSKPRRLQDWAAVLGVSARTITRAFQAETGHGYSRWISAMQAQRAIELIARGEDFQDVADDLGFSSISALGASFRRTTGFTLSAFKQE